MNIYVLCRNIRCVPIDSQVCFHRQPFANHVKTSWHITRPVEPLESTNLNWCGFKLLPVSVSTYAVNCAHPIHLLKPEHQYLCSSEREGPPWLVHTLPPPTCPIPPKHSLIHHTHDITVAAKNISKTSSEYWAAKLVMKH